MTITTITTHVEPATLVEVNAALASPFALAQLLSAHLTALVFRSEIDTTGKALPDAEAQAQEDAVAAHVREAMNRRGVSGEVRARSSFAYGAGEVFADNIRVSDVAVLSIGPSAGAGHRFLVSRAVFGGGRPLIILPTARPLLVAPRRVIVAWDATPAAVRALHDALPFIRQAEEAVVVSVTDDKELRPGQSGIEVTRLLARHGARATFQAVERRSRAVFDALAEVAEQRSADLLVMGAIGHSPLHNLVFGSATRSVLDSQPPLPVLLAA